MKVSTIEIENFRGIKKYRHDFKKPVTVISGPVGAGKTSFLQAFRFGITGDTPVNPIYDSENEAKVSLTSDPGLTIERVISKPNRKSVRVMGRKTGTSASEKFIEETTEVPNEIMKLASSSDVLAGMKPTQFGSIFLNESIEKKELSDLIKIIEECDLKEKKAVLEEGSEKLPADVLNLINECLIEKTLSLEAISKAHEEIKIKKKEAYNELKHYKEKAKDFESIVKPEYTESELRKKYDEIVGVERNVYMYMQSVKNYEKMEKAKEKENQRLSEISLLISMNNATAPDPEKLANLIKKNDSLNKEIISQSVVKKTQENNIKWMETNLKRLNEPTCPLSERLICHTDKSGLKGELESGIKSNKVALKITEDKINELKKIKADVEEEIVVYNKNKEKWAKKTLLIKEMENIKKNPVELPEKPETLSLKGSYKEEKEAITEKLNKLHSYKEAEKAYKLLAEKKKYYEECNFVEKALNPKGPVIKEFIKTFTDCLEEACNERAKLLNTEYEMKFIADEGLKVLFKSGPKKAFLPYQSLSAGEKIYASLLLTDLLNSFYGSKILILDDTDHLDAESFRQLMEFLKNAEIETLYDNILISCVKHDDILEVLKDYDEEIILM